MQAHTFERNSKSRAAAVCTCASMNSMLTAMAMAAVLFALVILRIMIMQP